jgi:hypothetical protein
MMNRISGDQYFQALRDMINACGSPEKAQKKRGSSGVLGSCMCYEWGPPNANHQEPNRNRMELRSGAGKLAAPKAHRGSPQFLTGSSVQEELVGLPSKIAERLSQRHRASSRLRQLCPGAGTVTSWSGVMEAHSLDAFFCRHCGDFFASRTRLDGTRRTGLPMLRRFPE